MPDEPAIAIERGTVLPMTGEPAIADATVVVLNGRILPRPELDAMMAVLAERYAPVREWFSPRASEILRDR